jgi:Type VI secretion system/phage-baseplate injector OB domain
MPEEKRRPPFYGKYRETVSDNADPLAQGRIRAKIPDILGDKESGWALPCAPHFGNGAGIFFIPPKGANIWIEFEYGHPDRPIWTGGFWGKPTELPVLSAPPLLPNKKVFKTDLCTITLDDTRGTGGITIESSVGSGAKIVMNTEGITISCGLSKLQIGPASVSVNDGALEVTSI